jgi:hypothetical protein
MSRIDVKHPLRTVALNASVGRIAPLQGPPRERPQSPSKPPFDREHELGVTAVRPGRHRPLCARVFSHAAEDVD